MRRGDRRAAKLPPHARAVPGLGTGGRRIPGERLSLANDLGEITERLIGRRHCVRFRRGVGVGEVAAMFGLRRLEARRRGEGYRARRARDALVRFDLPRSVWLL